MQPTNHAVLCAVLTQVPISLVYRKRLAKKDGSDHMLLHGYGSYEYPYDPRCGHCLSVHVHLTFHTGICGT